MGKSPHHPRLPADEADLYADEFDEPGPSLGFDDEPPDPVMGIDDETKRKQQRYSRRKNLPNDWQDFEPTDWDDGDPYS